MGQAQAQDFEIIGSVGVAAGKLIVSRERSVIRQ